MTALKFRCLIERQGTGKRCEWVNGGISLQAWVKHCELNHRNDVTFLYPVESEILVKICPVCQTEVPANSDQRIADHRAVHYESHYCQLDDCTYVVESNPLYGRHLLKEHANIVPELPGNRRDEWRERIRAFTETEDTADQPGVVHQLEFWRDSPQVSLIWAHVQVKGVMAYSRIT